MLFYRPCTVQQNVQIPLNHRGLLSIFTDDGCNAQIESKELYPVPAVKAFMLSFVQLYRKARDSVYALQHV